MLVVTTLVKTCIYNLPLFALSSQILMEGDLLESFEEKRSLKLVLHSVDNQSTSSKGG